MQNQLDISSNHPNIHAVLEVVALRFSDGRVFYKLSAGSKKSAEADSVVLYSGLKPRMDEAMKFGSAAPEVLLVGDCTGTNGTILKTVRSAYFAASRV